MQDLHPKKKEDSFIAWAAQPMKQEAEVNLMSSLYAITRNVLGSRESAKSQAYYEIYNLLQSLILQEGFLYKEVQAKVTNLPRIYPG